MLLRIEGRDLPGMPDVRVAVQRKDTPAELLDVQRGDAAGVEWDLECESFVDKDGVLTLRGPYIQNRLGGRFVYISWGEAVGDSGFKMFRRSKLMLSGVDPAVMAAAAGSGTLLCRLGMTDAKGQPICARLVPPRVEWSAV